MPCLTEILGLQFKSFLILEILASECLVSPGLAGINFFFPPNILAIVFIEVLLPDPKLYILLTFLLLIIFISALDKSLT